MFPDDINERIARWMGEYSDKAVRDFHGSDCGRSYAGPDYLHDPAAALRVLEAMEKYFQKTRLTEWRIEPSMGDWQCKAFHVGEYITKSYTADTPAAAIVTAWWAEFGNNEENKS